MMIHQLRDRFHKVLASILMVVVLGVCVGSVSVSIAVENADLFSIEIDFDNELEEDRLTDDKISDRSRAAQRPFYLTDDIISRFKDAPTPLRTHYLSISTPPPDVEILA